jgi:putative hemolysin
MGGMELALWLAGLLVLSGVFSGSETALFSIPSLRLREMSESASVAERAVARVMERPRRVLVTILVANMGVNILASAMGAAAAIRISGSVEAGVLVATLAMTFLILVVGEIAPKTVAYWHSGSIARAVARPLLILGAVLSPLRWPLLKLTDLVLGIERKPDERIELSEVEAMLRLAHAEGEVDAHEADLIRGVFELGTSPVEDVMTPRTEIFTLARDQRVGESRELVRRSGYSKIPVSGGDPDEMIGYVTALDLLLHDDAAEVASLARPAAYVPEVKHAVDLLEEFRGAGDRLAFVVDEHGHLSGLVTLTDLLEEISGEMIESGDLHKVLYERVGKHTVIIPGRMEIRFFNEEFGADVEAGEAETMAGLVLERVGRIPGTGESFEIQGLEVTVRNAEPHRLVTLEVTIPDRRPADEKGPS